MRGTKGTKASGRLCAGAKTATTTATRTSHWATRSLRRRSGAGEDPRNQGRTSRRAAACDAPTARPTANRSAPSLTAAVVPAPTAITAAPAVQACRNLPSPAMLASATRAPPARSSRRVTTRVSRRLDTAYPMDTGSVRSPSRLATTERPSRPAAMTQRRGPRVHSRATTESPDAGHQAATCEPAGASTTEVVMRTKTPPRSSPNVRRSRVARGSAANRARARGRSAWLVERSDESSEAPPGRDTAGTGLLGSPLVDAGQSAARCPFRASFPRLRPLGSTSARQRCRA